METVNKDKSAVAAKEINQASNSDVPADEIEDDRDTEGNSESDSDSSSESSSDSDSDSEYECKVCNRAFTGYLPFKQHQKGKKHAKAVLKKKKEKKLKKIDTAAESDEEFLIQEAYAECKICNKEFSGPEGYEQHLKCKKHKQNVLVASIREQVQEEGEISAEKLQDLYKNKRMTADVSETSERKLASFSLDEDDENKEFECKECEKIFSGLIPFTQHLVSKTHAKKLEQKNLLGKVFPGTSKDENSGISKEKDVSTLCVEDDVLVCKACSTSFSGPENAMTHMKSKKHAKNLDKYVRKLEKRREKKKSLNADEENDARPEIDDEDEITKEKLQSTSVDSGKSVMSNSSQTSTEKPSTSSNQNNGELIAREKYKAYKTLMNTLDDISL